MTFPARLSFCVWPLLSGALAALIYGLQHRMGIEVNADGWAYWQGGRSIANGLGYRYFSGDPIVAWPPLYSLYLSAWIKLCGSEAMVVEFANISLISMQGFFWTLACIRLYGTDSQRASIGYIAIYVALTIPLYEKQILAHNLTYTILPVFVMASWKRGGVGGRPDWFHTLKISGLGILLAESHISGMAYIAAAAFLFAVIPGDFRRERTVAALAVLAIPLAAWTLTAWWLAQIGGHPIEGGRFSFEDTLLQMFDGISYFVLPRLGLISGMAALIAFCVALTSRSFKIRANQTTFVFGFSFLSLLLLAIAFSVTWLNGFVSEPRHLLIIPLLVIPRLVSRLVTSKTVVMKAAAVLVFLAPVSRTFFLNDSVASDDFVPLHASISPVPGLGKTINIDGKTLVGPIAWEEPEGGYSLSGAPRWGFSQKEPAGSR